MKKKAQAIPPHKRDYSTRQISLDMHTAQNAFRRQNCGTHSSWSCRTGTRLQPSTEVPPGEGTGDRLPAAALRGLGQDWELWPTLNGSPEPWVEGMGGGLRSKCSLHMGYVGVLGSLPDITPHPKQGCLASGSLVSIFLGNKEPARLICRFLSPGLDVSCH